MRPREPSEYYVSWATSVEIGLFRGTSFVCSSRMIAAACAAGASAVAYRTSSFISSRSSTESTSSVSEYAPYRQHSAYLTQNTALFTTLARSLRRARDWLYRYGCRSSTADLRRARRTGVTANVLLPGCMTATNMTQDQGDSRTNAATAVMFAPMVWLASDASNGVTGRRR